MEGLLIDIMGKERYEYLLENPKDKDFVGAFVVRNRFHPPKNPYDGVKLYAGKDEYAYDKFGNIKIPKYYAIFTYDNVPNYSNPVVIFWH